MRIAAYELDLTLTDNFDFDNLGRNDALIKNLFSFIL